MVELCPRFKRDRFRGSLLSAFFRAIAGFFSVFLSSTSLKNSFSWCPGKLPREGGRAVKQGASGTSSHLSGLAEGLPDLARRPRRRAGPPQPCSWRDHASAQTSRAYLSMVSPVEDFSTTYRGFGFLPESSRKTMGAIQDPKLARCRLPFRKSLANQPRLAAPECPQGGR
jgi:hypothetical protein